jgi:hypothetical protein
MECWKAPASRFTGPDPTGDFTRPILPLGGMVAKIRARPSM